MTGSQAFVRLIALTSALLVSDRSASVALSPAPSTPRTHPDLERAIKAFEGSWTITEEYFPSPDVPKGGQGKGTEVWRRGPGGLSLMYEYQSASPAGDVTALAVLWWDEDVHGLRELWCFGGDSAGCRLSTAKIAWTGAELIFDDARGEGDKRRITRETWTDITQTSHTMVIADGAPGEALHPWLISHATRKTESLGR